jgi:molecular chaperone DnaK
MLKESGDKLEPADKINVEEGIAAVKKALAEDNLESLKKAMEELTESVYAATTKLYQKMQAEEATQQQAGAGASPEQGKPADDNVVNADYNVKEE